MSAQELRQEPVREAAERVASGLGLEIVDLALRRAGNRWRLRVDVDRAGPSGVTLDECQQVSRALGQLLEAGELIPASYVLEVSSPGIDRPIRTPDDIRRNTGRQVVVQTREPVEGRRSFRGTLLGELDGCVVLRLESVDAPELRIPLATIATLRQDARF